MRYSSDRRSPDIGWPADGISLETSDLGSPVSPKRSFGVDIDELKNPHLFPIPKHATSRGPSEQFRAERERAHVSLSRTELLKILINTEYELRQTKKVSVIALERLKLQKERADENELTALDATDVLKRLVEEKKNLERELDNTKLELRALGQQFGEAQSNIVRAQGVVDELSAELDAADAKAKETRQMLRQIERERDMEEVRRVAFLDGKREGQMAGFDHGRQLGWKEHIRHARRNAAKAAGRAVSPGDTFDDDELPPFGGIIGGPTILHHDNRRLSGPIAERAPSLRRDAPLPQPPAQPPFTRDNSAVRPRSSSRSQVSAPQQLPARPPSSPLQRPLSAQTSHRNLPPDGFIPTLSADGQGIQIPPPFELNENVNTDVFSNGSRAPSPSTGPFRPPTVPAKSSTPKGTERKSRRRNSADSGVSALTSLGELLSTPGIAVAQMQAGAGTGNLSTIIEASDSGRSATLPSHSRSHSQSHPPPEFGKDLNFNTPSSATGPNLAMDAFDRQRIADQLRYSDPTLAEEWRKHPAFAGAESNAGGVPNAYAANHTARPTIVTAPSPLRLSLNSPQRPSNQQRKSTSSEGSTRIQIVPPSRSVSYADTGSSYHDPGALSPNHQPTPMQPMIPTEPNTPVQRTHQVWPSTNDATGPVVTQGRQPRIFQDVSSSSQHFANPYMPVAPPSDHRASPTRENTTRGSPQPIMTSIGPDGKHYPILPPISTAPYSRPASEAASQFHRVPSQPSLFAVDLDYADPSFLPPHNATVSNVHAHTPTVAPIPLTPGGKPRNLLPQTSRTSLNSNGAQHKHWERNEYLDPAYLAAGATGGEDSLAGKGKQRDDGAGWPSYFKRD